jgi:hypothetical protein
VVTLTSEPVTTLGAALDSRWIYGRRWRIEEFHKAWKSGTQGEACPEPVEGRYAPVPRTTLS